MPPTPNRIRLLAAALSAAALAALPGCIPSRFVIDLDPPDGKLTETAVLSDSEISDDSLPKIVLINVDGLISHTSPPGLLASRGNTVDTIVTRLTKAELDPRVRAVILRINSPGGTVAASETLYHEIEGFRARTGKPVVASFAEVAASGGYYMALAADAIVAQPSSITGSIGVIVQTFNFSKGMAMIGIDGRAITSRDNKDLASPFEPAVEEHYAILQGMVNEFYATFRGLVLTRRPALAAMTADKIDTATDGRVFTGLQARELGLVDDVGGLRDAFILAKRLADVPSARLMKYHSRGSAPSSPYAAADLPAVDAATAPAGREINVLQVNLPEGLAPGAGFYYLWTP